MSAPAEPVEMIRFQRPCGASSRVRRVAGVRSTGLGNPPFGITDNIGANSPW